MEDEGRGLWHVGNGALRVTMPYIIDAKGLARLHKVNAIHNVPHFAGHLALLAGQVNAGRHEQEGREVVGRAPDRLVGVKVARPMPVDERRAQHVCRPAWMLSVGVCGRAYE